MNVNRKFGIEIEAFNVERRVVAQALNAAGIACEVQGYNHHISDVWKVITDSSIVGCSNGFELVSPVLSGNAGIEQVKKVCEALKTIGVKVNKSCGLHVHIDARQLSVRDIKAVIGRYALNEDIIDAFMPISRRGNNNRYCASILNDYQSQSQAFQTLEDCITIRDIAEDFAHEDRYFKLNIQSYLRHGSIEFRQHSGTIVADKIVNWIGFCQQFVDGAVAGVNLGHTGTFAERFEDLFSTPVVQSSSMKQLKQAVMSALGFTTTAQVKVWAKQQNLTLDLRCKASWQAILTAVSSATANTNEINEIKAFYRRRMAQLHTDRLLAA